MKSLKNLRKRGLALFLALTMCMSLLPATALAEELTVRDDLTAAEPLTPDGGELSEIPDPGDSETLTPDDPAQEEPSESFLDKVGDFFGDLLGGGAAADTPEEIPAEKLEESTDIQENLPESVFMPVIPEGARVIEPAGLVEMNMGTGYLSVYALFMLATQALQSSGELAPDEYVNTLALAGVDGVTVLDFSAYMYGQDASEPLELTADAVYYLGGQVAVCYYPKNVDVDTEHKVEELNLLDGEAYASISGKIQNAEVAYVYWTQQDTDGNWSNNNYVKTGLTAFPANGLSIPAFSKRTEYDGHLRLFVKPAEGCLLIGADGGGRSEIIGIDATSTDGLPGNIISDAKTAKYVAVLQYNRTGIDRYKDLSESVDIEGIPVTLDATATSDKTTGVVPGNLLTFTVTLTTTDLQKYSGAGVDSITIDAVTINGKPYENPKGGPFTAEKLAGSDRTYTLEIPYTATEADCDLGEVTLSVTATAKYTGVLALTSGGNADTSVEEQKTATATCKIAQKTGVSYRYQAIGTEKPIPAEVATTKPADDAGIYPGKQVSVPNLSQTSVTVPGDGIWTFEGWYLNGTSIAAGTAVTVPEGGLTFVGKWSFTPNVTITYVAETPGGTVNPTRESVAPNGTATGSTASPEAGYTFAGWKDSSGNVVSQETHFTPAVASNATYTATWTAVEYTISYDLAGGTVAGTNPTVYTVESKDITLTNPTKDGYKFLGWTLKGADDQTPAPEVTIQTGSTGNRTYTANWEINKHTVSYKVNGDVPADYKAPANATVTHDSKYTVADVPADQTGTEDGVPGTYTFDGWYKDGEKVTSLTSVTADVELTGTWSFTGATYTVTLPTEGERVGYTLSPTASSSNPVTHGDSYSFTLTVDPAYNKTTAVVKVKNTNGTGSEETLTTADGVYTISNITENKSVTVEVTRNTYTVTFKAEGSQDVVKTVDHGGSLAANEFPAVPEKSGYTGKWDRTAEQLTNITEDVEVTAKYTPSQYTVTLNANGGKFEDGQETCEQKVTFDAAYGTLPTPAKANYTFDGWFTLETGGDKVIADTKVAIAGNHTLYAHWTAKTEVEVTITLAERTYNGQAQGIKTNEYTVTEGAGDVTVTYSTDGGETWTTNAPINAGTYQVKVSVEETVTHAYAEETAELAIGQATLTVTAKDHSITYGEAPANAGVDYTGFVNDETADVLSGTLTYTYSYEQYGNVGNDYIITPGGLTAANYAISFEKGTLTVAQKEVTLVWSNTEGRTYNDGKSVTATLSGVVNNDVVTVHLTGNTETAVGGPYTAAATLGGAEAGNYTLSNPEATYSIAKADEDALLKAIEASWPTTDPVVYDPNRTLNEVTLKSDSTLGTFAWTNPSTGNLTVPGGKYEVTFTLKDEEKANYSVDELTGEVQLTVTKAKQPTPTFTLSATEVKVNGNVTLTRSNEPLESGEVTYTSSKPEIATVDETGKITAIGAGSTVITVTYGETANYLSATSEPVTLTVKPLADSKKITVFTIPNQAFETEIDQEKLTIEVTMPYTADLTKLTPSIIHSGVSISPASGAEQDFTNPVTYTVTAENGEQAKYTVTVIKQLEKLTKVTAPESPVKLTQDYADANAVIDTLPKTVAAEKESGPFTPRITWMLQGESFNAEVGGSNVFVWTVKDEDIDGLDRGNVPVSGEITVNNWVASETPVGSITGTTSITLSADVKDNTTTLEASLTVPEDTSTVTYQWQKKSGETWENVNGETGATLTLSELTMAANGAQYKCVVTNAEEGKAPATAELTAVTLDVQKGTQAAPELTVTQPAVIDGTGSISDLTSAMEYSTDGENWTTVGKAQTSIDNITAPATYQVRYAETDYLKASSEATCEIKKFAPAKEPTPVAKFEAKDMTLSNVEVGQSYSLDGTTFVQITGNSVDMSKADLKGGSVIRIKMPGNGTTTIDSEIQEITLTQAAVPAGTVTDETAYQAKDGAITITNPGVDYVYQISSNNGNTWENANVTDGKIAPLAPGSYILRVQGKGTMLGSEPSQVLTVKAQPAPVYSITYNLAGGALPEGKSNPATYTYGVGVESFVPASKNGHVFIGWFNGDNDDAAKVTSISNTSTGDVTLYAKFAVDANGNNIPDEDEEKYTVTYSDGAKGAVFADDVHGNLLSGTATPKFSGSTERKDYVFVGWNVEVAETVTADATYTAQWKDDKNNNGKADEDEEKYTVTYRDGAEGAVFADDVHGNLLSGTATPEFIGSTERKDYVFVGWNVEVAETVTADATYTATWAEDKNNDGIDDSTQAHYTVTYSDGADGSVFETVTIGNVLVDTATPAFDGNLTRAGYVFGGWDPELAETVTGNADYTATWKVDANGNGEPDEDEEHFDITYAVNGYVPAGYTVPETASVVTGGSYTVAAVPASQAGTLNGTAGVYTFSGWFNGSETVTTLENVTEAVELTGTWTFTANLPDTYTVSYTVNGDVPAGYTAPAAVTVARGGTYTVAAAPAAQAGTLDGVAGTYTFSGWSQTGTLTVNGNVTITGTWTFTANPGGGTGGGGGTTPVNPVTPVTPVTPNNPTPSTNIPENPTPLGPDAPTTNIDDEDTPLAGIDFGDVTPGDWFYEAVQFVFDRGLMLGVSENEFGPHLSTTRGMIVTILHRMEGTPVAAPSPFTDVAAGQWYYDAIGWAAANEIVNGYGDGRFGPLDTITREQMAAIFFRYSQYKGYDVTARADLSAYTDADTISAYAVEAMQWAVGVGLINGMTADTLVPRGHATRAQVATILMRFCLEIADDQGEDAAPAPEVEDGSETQGETEPETTGDGEN